MSLLVALDNKTRTEKCENIASSKYIANCACVDTLCYGNAIQSELNFPSLELLTAEWQTHDNPDHTALMHCLNTCRC